MTESRKVRWVRHVAYMGRTQKHKFQSENTNKRDCLEDESAHGRKIRLLLINKADIRVLIDLN
jgi:hypothetical protein